MRISRPFYIGLLLLFAGSFAVYNWVFDYVVVLQYGTADCFFLFSREFLTEWLDHPGGLLFYAGRFLRQFYHYPWLGALVLSSAITGFGLSLYLVLKRLLPGVGLFPVFLPCIFLLPLHSVGVDIAIGLMVVCGAFLGYLALPGDVSRQAYALLATPVLYVVVGGYFWFFVVWTIGAVWFGRPWSAELGFKLLYPVLAVGVPLAAYRWVFPISLSAALNLMLFTDLSFGGLPFCYIALLVPFWARVPWGSRFASFGRSRRGAVAQVGLLAGLAVLLLRLSYDPATRLFADYHRLYKNRQWDGILDKAAKEPLPHRAGQFFTGYALYHQGKLLEKMFNYPQGWGASGLVLCFADQAEELRQGMYRSDLFFEMGHVNAAFNCAYNQLILGRTYENLERIAACNMVNGNYQIAGKYLKLLERTLFHGEFARRYLEVIADTAAADRYFAAARARRPTVELDLELGDFAAFLALLESDPGNRMAFDYLTAWCLLDKTSMPLVAENINRFREAGYTAIPTYVQEALMVWARSTDTAVDTQGYLYDADTRARFARFEQEAQRYPGRDEARRGLAPAFGGTYIYHYIFTAPPRGGMSAASWVQLGREFYSLGKVDEAVGYYRQALREDPESAEAQICLGNALFSQGKVDEGAAYYYQAAQGAPGSSNGPESGDRTGRLRSH